MAFRFQSLKIWHQSRAYAKTVYGLTVKFPRKEDYSLTSQMNRAVNSISINIAEGSGKKTAKHFDSYLDTSVGSTFEVVACGFLALDRGYITEQELKQLYDEGELLGRSINAFRRTLWDSNWQLAITRSAISHPLYAISRHGFLSTPPLFPARSRARRCHAAFGDSHLRPAA